MTFPDLLDLLGEHGPLEMALPRLTGLDRGSIDPEVLKHVKYVDPVIMDNLRSYVRDKTYNGKEVFKHVLRFWKVLRAYQSKREGWSDAKAQVILARLKSTFGAAAGPGNVLALLQ